MKVSNSKERLLQLLEYSGDSQSEMARKSNLEKSAISNYIKGKRVPRQDKVLAIANAYNVNPSWLMGLDVPMRTSDVIEMSEDKSSRIDEALKLYELYQNAIPEIQSAVESLLKGSRHDS